MTGDHCVECDCVLVITNVRCSLVLLGLVQKLLCVLAFCTAFRRAHGKKRRTSGPFGTFAIATVESSLSYSKVADVNNTYFSKFITTFPKCIGQQRGYRAAQLTSQKRDYMTKCRHL
jgi:hypothetical protein